MEPHRVLQETAYPSLAYGLFGLGRFLQQIPDSYKRVIFMSICGSIWLSLDIHCLNRGDDDIAANCLTTVDSVAFLRASGHNAKLPEFLLADPRK